MLGLRPYDPAHDSDGLHHDDSPCALAVEDRGLASIIQSANRENAYEVAAGVYSITHPPVRIGPVCIPTIGN